MSLSSEIWRALNQIRLLVSSTLCWAGELGNDMGIGGEKLVVAKKVALFESLIRFENSCAKLSRTVCRIELVWGSDRSLQLPLHHRCPYLCVALYG